MVRRCQLWGGDSKELTLTASADGPPLTTIRDALVNVHLLPIDSRADRFRCNSNEVLRVQEAKF